MAKFFPKERPIALPIQLYNLSRRMPSGIGRMQGKILAWRCWLQPTPLSRHYRIELLYSLGGLPEIFVREPDLTKIAGGRTLPHVYNQKPTKLCLFLPSSGEWSCMKLLSETIMPWTALWLFYFEDWLMSDIWNGGGHSPALSDKTGVEEAA